VAGYSADDNCYHKSGNDLGWVCNRLVYVGDPQDRIHPDGSHCHVHDVSH